MGLILKIIGFIFLAIVLIIGGTVFYFYNYHVFKTFRICIPEESQDTMIPCSNNAFCTQLFENTTAELKQTIDNSPEFLKEKISQVMEECVFCNNHTCHIKTAYGDVITPDFTGECNPGDTEIKQEIRGKEGIEILKYLKNQIKS